MVIKVASDSTSSEADIRKFLEEAGIRARAQLDAYMAQDPLTIDLVGRIPYLPGMVVDALIEIKDQLSDKSRAEIEDWQDEERTRYRASVAKIEFAANTFRESLPPNWHSPEVWFPSFELVEQLQLDEGLPLAWLPPNRVLSALLDLETSESRRNLIEQEAAAILDACLAELEPLGAILTREWRASAQEALLSMKAGHWRAGQALSAIALDTAVSEFMITRGFKDATKQRQGNRPTPPGSLPTSFPSWEEIDYARVSLVMYGIWGAFGWYKGKDGEPVPTRFTRHGTVHSMSPRQYTKANALIAIMHLVSLLCLLDEMIEDQAESAERKVR